MIATLLAVFPEPSTAAEQLRGAVVELRSAHGEAGPRVEAPAAQGAYVVAAGGVPPAVLARARRVRNALVLLLDEPAAEAAGNAQLLSASSRIAGARRFADRADRKHTHCKHCGVQLLCLWHSVRAGNRSLACSCPACRQLAPVAKHAEQGGTESAGLVYNVSTREAHLLQGLVKAPCDVAAVAVEVQQEMCGTTPFKVDASDHTLACDVEANKAAMKRVRCFPRSSVAFLCVADVVLVGPWQV